MALFKSNKDSNASTETSKAQTTFVSEGIEVTGNIKGTGAVQVEGTLHGNIAVNSVIIGEAGIVNGVIHAKYVVINGKLNGGITCESLEIMKNGHVANVINVKKLKISGFAEGEIDAEDEIIVSKEGKIKAREMLSKNIIVNGSFSGNVTASELLEIGEAGSVEGEITVKNIKTHEGGKLIGSMRNYEAPKSSKKEDVAKKTAK